MNPCLHCLGRGYEIGMATGRGAAWAKQEFPCLNCNGTGRTRKHIHKACRSRFNYPVCNPGNTMHNAMVTLNWKIVTCPSCLKGRRN